jgi:hypothetical protein
MNRSVWLCGALFAASVLSASAFALEGVIDLGPEEFVQAHGQDIVVPGYSVPSFADWNADGRKDLIVGEGGGGAPGKIRVYLNVGNESDPCFGDFFYAQSDGRDLVFESTGCLGCFPRVIDWYRDLKDDKYQGHRIDLLVGFADGTVKVFQNSRRGALALEPDSAPSFDEGTTIMVGPTYTDILDVGARATPVFVDWNNDNEIDIVAGGLDGGLHLYYNCGCGGYIPPRFSTSPIDGVFAQANGRDLFVPSGRSSPVVMDVDGDGNKDLITGNTDGQILFYRNIGTNTLPIFAGYTMVQSDGKPIDLAGNQRSRPDVCYWTGSQDGYWDLLVGYGDGKIRLYRGIPKTGDFNGNGTLDGDDFTILVQALDKPVPAQGSPADLNHDGVVDDLDLHLFVDLWRAEHGGDKK